MKSLLCGILLFCLSGHLCAQTLPDTVGFREQVSQHLYRLSSMKGRGYVGKGHLQAAQYIEKAFRNARVQAFPQGYQQFFDFPLNLIDKATLTLNGKTLTVGRDFIPHPSTPARSGKKVAVKDVGYGLPDHYKAVSGIAGSAVIIRSGFPKDANLDPAIKTAFARDEARIQHALDAGASAVILIQEKLTHSFSDQRLKIPVFVVKASVLTTLSKIESVSYSVSAKMQNVRTQNVAGFVKGTSVPDSAMILCAHYDHLGKIGKATFTGANDNASGTGFLLTMAAYYAKHPQPYTLIFIAFGAEEAGLHGSMYYTAREPLFPLAQTKFVLNYDLMGNGQEGVMTVAGKTFALAFEALQRLNEEQKLIQPLASRPNAPNSDHYPFTLKDVPAFFFYTQGGAKAYHDIDDLPNNLSLPAINRMFALTDLFLRTYLMR